MIGFKRVFPEPLQFGANVRVIVYFAIEDNRDFAVGRQHRLVRRRRQIDDRQPAMAEHTVLGWRSP